MPEFTVVSVRDASMRARITHRKPLFYRDGADKSLDRPAHIRAGSSLARVGNLVAVVQDDANFLALFDPQNPAARAIALPAGQGGVRQFDDGRGNKKWKLDLEACAGAPLAEGGTLLLAFGSGSSSRRERVLMARFTGEDAEPRLTVIDAPALYAALREAKAFSGSELNVEGALFCGDTLRLFNRGNGEAREGLRPANATCELSWPALLSYLDDTSRPVPRVERVTSYDLGKLDGVNLSFTDAAHAPHGSAVLYSAAAENSPDATRDGSVSGSVLGVLDERGARDTPLLNENGEASGDKVEGVLWLAPQHALIVLDRDDPNAPSELCEVELAGF